MSDEEIEAQAMGNLHEAALELMEDYGWTADDICKEVHAIAPVESGAPTPVDYLDAKDTP